MRTQTISSVLTANGKVGAHCVARGGEQLGEEKGGGEAVPQQRGALQCACTARHSFAAALLLPHLLYASWCGERRNQCVQIRGCSALAACREMCVWSLHCTYCTVLPFRMSGCLCFPAPVPLFRRCRLAASQRPGRQRPEPSFCRVPQLRELTLARALFIFIFLDNFLLLLYVFSW